MWDVKSSLGFCTAYLAEAVWLVLSIFFIGKVVRRSFIYTFIIFMLKCIETIRIYVNLHKNCSLHGHITGSFLVKRFSFTIVFSYTSLSWNEGLGRSIRFFLLVAVSWKSSECSENKYFFLFHFYFVRFTDKHFKEEICWSPIATQLTLQVMWKRTQGTTWAINAVTLVMLLQSLHLKKPTDALYSNLQFCDSHL